MPKTRLDPALKGQVCGAQEDQHWSDIPGRNFLRVVFSIGELELARRRGVKGLFDVDEDEGRDVQTLVLAFARSDSRMVPLRVRTSRDDHGRDKRQGGFAVLIIDCPFHPHGALRLCPRRREKNIASAPIRSRALPRHVGCRPG